MADNRGNIETEVIRLQEAISLAVMSIHEIRYIANANGPGDKISKSSSVYIAHSENSFIEWMKRIVKIRDARSKFFPSDELFAEPAWDMLLDLCISSLQGKKVSVTSLCIAARVPPTTALRWINVLEKQSYIERTSDENDARRSFLSVTELGLNAMRNLYQRSADKF
jgi:hypothetical protein